jgi:hypothetical protein
MWTSNRAFFLVIALLAAALGIESAHAIRDEAEDASAPVTASSAEGPARRATAGRAAPSRAP